MMDLALLRRVLAHLDIFPTWVIGQASSAAAEYC